MMLRLIVLTVSMVYLEAAEGPLRFEVKRVEKKTTGCVLFGARMRFDHVTARKSRFEPETVLQKSRTPL